MSQLIFSLALLISSVSFAELKPENSVILDQCSSSAKIVNSQNLANTVPSVCIGRIVGRNEKFVVVKSVLKSDEFFQTSENLYKINGDNPSEISYVGYKSQLTGLAVYAVVANGLAKAETTFDLTTGLVKEIRLQIKKTEIRAFDFQRIVHSQGL